MALRVDYQTGSYGQGTEWIHDFLFDRYRLLATNPLETALFRDKPGSTRNGTVLTIIDTNNKGDRVPTAQKWYLWELQVTYQAAALQADATLQFLLTWMQNTLVNFKIENLDTMFSIPLSALRPTLQNVSAPAVTVNSRYPQQDNRGGQELRVPLVLEQNAVWHLDLISVAASNAALDNSFMLFTWQRELFRQAG